MGIETYSSLHLYLPRSELLEQNDATVLVYLLALLQSCDDEVARGKPSIGVVVKPVQELGSHQRRGLQKLGLGMIPSVGLTRGLRNVQTYVDCR